MEKTTTAELLEKYTSLLRENIDTKKQLANSLKNEIRLLEGVKEMRSQLIDGGYNEDSLIILALDNLINKSI